MPLPLEEHVRLILLERDRGRRMYEAVAAGWEAFKVNYPRRSLWRRKATSRNVFWEEVAERLVVMEDDDGVEVLMHRDTLSLIFDDEVLVRVKHADFGLATQNVPTGEAINFCDHDVDLFGRSGLQRVRLCYVLNEFETQLEWVGIAAHSKRNFLWKIELGAEGMTAPVPRLPMDAPEVDTSTLARLKSRPSEESKKKKDIGE